MQRRAAPTRTAHAAVARKRSPARLCMMMSETPLPTLALGRSAKRLVHRASRAAQSARRLRQRHAHHQEATRALSAGAHAGARARSAHAIGAERAARGHDWAAAGARARSAHAIGAERVARGGASCELACWRSQHTDTLGGFCLLAHRRRPGAQRPRHRRRARSARCRWQPAAAPPGAARHTGAQRRAPSAPSARSAVRRARNARRRSGSPQAPGAQSAHATGAERVARGGASCELACCLLAQPAHTDTLWSLGGFCLLAHNSNIVSGLMTMSPAHGVGPL